MAHETRDPQPLRPGELEDLRRHMQAMSSGSKWDSGGLTPEERQRFSDPEFLMRAKQMLDSLKNQRRPFSGWRRGPRPPFVPRSKSKSLPSKTGSLMRPKEWQPEWYRKMSPEQKKKFAQDAKKHMLTLEQALERARVQGMKKHGIYPGTGLGGFMDAFQRAFEHREPSTIFYGRGREQSGDLPSSPGPYLQDTYPGLFRPHRPFGIPVGAPQ